ncbi:hypothetical protein DFH07DRAFT_1018375 [Mycena maculata]|uniref:SWIM-type domain-containing protein n=1 Tax=Mycena maculata TaxID=230809 RepID=A0AAD7JIU2_9AGAR|nr:hypothetical protein DFH07DRAFT_1018375 [Mycena maculata]
MYMFCFQRGLREVWGYFWTSWYAPKRWKLWARSTSPYVSRLRTTMNVENFWKQLKHGFLHNHLCPRLDLLVWILITKVTPAYLMRAQLLADGYRLGRSKPLTPFQKQFKTAWITLSKLPISDDADRKYITCVEKWTCTCKAYPYHPCHLCKHLVQAVGPLPAKFWGQVIRRRTVPLYRHPALVAKNQEMGKYVEPTDGSITDGDDHAWSGDHAVLEGDGGWRDFDFREVPSLLGKRCRSPLAGSDDTEDEREVHRHFFPSADAQESDEEEEVEEKSQQLLNLADDLERAAEILRAQASAKNSIWMSSILRRNIGKDVSLMVADIERYESTGRKRDNTWGKKGDKEANRRVANTMGYQIQN